MVTKYPDNLQGYLWIANNASAKDPDSEIGPGKTKVYKSCFGRPQLTL